MGSEIKSNSLLFTKPFVSNAELDREIEWALCNDEIDKEYLAKHNIKTINIEEYEDQKVIHYFTFDDDRMIFEILRTNKDFKLRKDDYKELVFDLDDTKVKVFKLSDVFPIIRSIFPAIGTTERFGKCFDGSMDVIENLPIDGDLVTGYHYGLTDKSKYLHSWVETKLFSEDYVIDFTLNAIINKEGFYKLKRINKEEILERISKETIISDKEKYKDYFNAMNLKVTPYNVFRDEIVRELERKKLK